MNATVSLSGSALWVSTYCLAAASNTFSLTTLPSFTSQTIITSNPAAWGVPSDADYPLVTFPYPVGHILLNRHCPALCDTFGHVK